MTLLVPVLIGAVLSVPLLVLSRSRGRQSQRMFWGVALVAAAVLYVGFAAWGGRGSDLGFEISGVFLFAAVATIGVMRWPPALAIGWLVHVAWDLLFHPIDPAASGYAPWWYPALCIGFDLFVAGYLLAEFVRSAESDQNAEFQANAYRPREDRR